MWQLPRFRKFIWFSVILLNGYESESGLTSTVTVKNGI